MNSSLKTVTRRFVIFAFVAVIAGYAYLKIAPLFSGPHLTVLNPQNGVTLHKDLLDIKGSADNVSFISLNNRPIFTDKQGSFNEQLLLYPGYNIITLTAKDRLGRMTEKKLQVVYQAPPAPEMTAQANQPTTGT